MNGVVNFDSTKVKDTQKKMYKLVLSIIDDLKEVDKVIKDSDSFFDCPSGKHYREISENILKMETNYIKNDVFEVIKKLDNVISIYSGFNFDTKKSVSGDKS